MGHDQAPASLARPEERDQYRPGYEVVAERILEYIAQHQLKPGDRLPTEAGLGQELDASRTVVREAVKILSALGRLNVRKGAGIFVADEPSALAAGETFRRFLPADPQQVKMLFEFRRLVEVETARLAAMQAVPTEVRAIRDAAQRSLDHAHQNDFAQFRMADETFHLAIGAASHNVFLESSVAMVTQLKRQVLTIGLRGDPSGSMQVAGNEHVTIAAAIADADPHAAQELMREHVWGAYAQFNERIQRHMLDLTDTRATS